MSAWRKRFSGAATTVAINPLNPNTVYAEGALGTFYVSYDRGNTWVQRSSPSLTQFRQILVHPSDTMTIFCAAFTGSLRKSTDYGGTWHTVIPSYGIDGESITYDPIHPDTMYAGNFGDGIIYRSTDRGETWIVQGTLHSVMCALAVRPDSVNVLYAGSGGGTISKSNDFGTTWRIVKNGGYPGGEVPKIVTNTVNPEIIYAAEFNNPQQGVWKSTDGGEQWNQTSLAYVSMWSMAGDLQNTDVVYAGTFYEGNTTVYATTNGGVSWNSLYTGMPSNGDIWSLKLHPLNSNVLWAAVTNGAFGSGGIYRWSTSTTSIQGHVMDVQTDSPVTMGLIGIGATGDSVDLGTSGGSFTFNYYDGDSSLTPTVHISAYPYYPQDEQLTFVLDSTRTQNFFVRKLPQSSIHGLVKDSLTGNPVPAKVRLYLATSGGGLVLYDSTDVVGAFHFDSLFISYPGIVSYTKLEIEPYELPFTTITLGPLTLDSLGLNFTVDPRADVFLVGEDSASYSSYYVSALQSLGLKTYMWNLISKGPAPLSKVNQFQKKFLIYFSGTKHTPLAQAEAESLETYVQNGGNLFLTGQDIIEMNDTTRLVRDQLGVAFAGNGYTVARGLGTDDLFSSMGFLIVGLGGASNQSSPDIMAILNPKIHAVFAAGSSAGVAGIRLVDSATGGKVICFGFGFEAINPFTNRKNVLQKIIGYFDGSIVLGVDDLSNGDIPSTFTLMQNYPNPFNPSTTFTFVLPKPGTVSLKVYNIFGQEIATVLNNKKMSEGKKEIRFDANGLPSGLYFYRLTEYVAGQENSRMQLQQTRKMLLIK